MTPITNLNLYDSIDLKLKRDDLYPMYLGGNKARKIEVIGHKAMQDGYTVIVTNGALNSNHCRATAMFCAVHNIKCHLVLHTNQSNPKLNNNALLSKLAGATISFTTLDNLSDKMDEAIEQQASLGEKPYYLWGGGHTTEGASAYYDAYNEAYEQCEQLNWIPDYIVFPTGTGTTHAGLHLANQNKQSHTQIVGISIAREKERGMQVVQDSITDLQKHLNIKNENKIELTFLDNYICSGHESYNQDILDCIQKVAKKGVYIDPTYTGKAFWGMQDLIQSGYIKPKSKVLFWHTGGVFNLLAESNLFNPEI